MAAYLMRPMTLGELVDRSLTILRRHFGLLAGITLVTSVLPYAAYTAFLIAMPPGRVATLDTGAQVARNLVEIIVLYPLSFMGFVVSQACLVFATSAIVMGGRPTMGQAFAAVRGHIARTAGIALIALIGIGVALLPCGMPGVLLASRWCAGSQAMLLEGLTPDVALRRSWDLTQGSVGRALLLGPIALAVSLVAFVTLSAPLALPFYLMRTHGEAPPAYTALMQLGMLLTQLVTTPLLNVLYVLFYFDLRVRREGFDVELLLRRLDLPPPLPRTESA